MNRILRYEVPVDGKWHRTVGHGAPLYVGCRDSEVVEFWAWQRDDPSSMEFCVAGTGEWVDTSAEYVGTAMAPGGQLVWHLLGRP